MKKCIPPVIALLFSAPVSAENTYPDVSKVSCELNQYHIKNSQKFDKNKIKIKKTDSVEIVKAHMDSRYYSNIDLYFHGNPKYFYNLQWVMSESAYVPYTYYNIGPYYFDKVFLSLKDGYTNIEFSLDHKANTVHGTPPAPIHYASSRSISLKFDKNTVEKIINEGNENIRLYMKSWKTGLSCVQISSSEFKKLYESIKAPL